MLAQSNNERCNKLQVIQGFFLESKQAPEAVQEMAHHGGWSTAPATIRTSIDSLRKEVISTLHKLGVSRVTAKAYDNLELMFKTGTTTLLNQSTFESITTALFFALKGVKPDDLKCVKEVEAVHALPQPGFDEIVEPLSDFETLERIRQAMIWAIKGILVEHAPQYRSNLERIPSKLDVPPEKTHHMPAFAMHYKCGTTDGNIEILEKLDEQASISDEIRKEYVQLIFADLGVLERLESVVEARAIEENVLERYQNIIALPGLFHFKMALANALYRLYLTAKDRNDASPSSVYQQFVSLYPQDTAKLNTNPPFKMLNEGFSHITDARVLDCWRLVCGHSTLDAFLDENPSWERISTLAEEIFDRFVWGRQAHDGDNTFRNGLLFNRDALLYRVLTLAINFGAIGLVEDVMCISIPIFKATGKHKYCAHTTKVLMRLRRYPPGVQQAAYMNLLCNPSGRKDGFRPVDWLVELNNLYIKVSQSVLVTSCIQHTFAHRSSMLAAGRIEPLVMSSSSPVSSRYTESATKRS